MCELIESLRCDACHLYLSYPPVTLTLSGRNVCGRCNLTDDEKSTSILNSVYEKSAELISFPCRYDNCDETYNIKKMKLHEDDHIAFKCPIDNCNWNENYKDLYNHFEKDHEEQIFENYRCPKPSIESNSLKGLIKFNGFTFLISYEYNISNGRLSYFTRLVDNDMLVDLFESNLKLTGSETQILKSRKVQSINDCFSSEKSIELNVNHVIMALGGYYADLEVAFYVSMIKKQCSSCNNELKFYPIYFKNDKYYCCMCNPESNPSAALQKLNLNELSITNPTPGMIYKCKHCRYTTEKEQNLLKHQIWLCDKASMKCNWGCGEKVKGEKLFYHYYQHCEVKEAIPNNFSFDFSMYEKTFKNQMNEWYKCAIVIKDTIFLFRYKLTTRNFCLNMISNIEVENMNKYFVDIVILDKKFGFPVQTSLLDEDWSNQKNRWDVCLNDTSNFQNFFFGNLYYEITIKLFNECKEEYHSFDIKNVHESRVSPDGRISNCPNLKVGCAYFDKVNNNLIKHEIWFCSEKSNQCIWYCKQSFFGSLFEHYLAHCKFKGSLELAGDNELYVEDQKFDTWHHYVVSVEDIKFLIRFRLTKSSFQVSIVSNTTAELTQKLGWSFELTHLDSGFFYRNNLLKNQWNAHEQFWDYYFNVDFNTESFLDEDVFHLSLFIGKCCPRCIDH